MRRIPLVRQMTSTDCGAAALAMVLRLHGRYVPLDELRRVLDIGRNGATLEAILRGGRTYGLSGRAVEVGAPDVDALPIGTILFWERRHFLVLERTSTRHVHVADPGSGRKAIPRDAFARGFSSVASSSSRTPRSSRVLGHPPLSRASPGRSSRRARCSSACSSCPS